MAGDREASDVELTGFSLESPSEFEELTNLEGEGEGEHEAFLKKWPSASVRSGDDGEEGERPPSSLEERPRWNESKTMMVRLVAVFYSFVMLGIGDGACGALIPYLDEYYQLSYTTISFIFLAPVVGYVGTALANNAMHVRFGQRGVAMTCAGSHLVAYFIVLSRPAYPILIVSFIILAFGNGFADAGWNAWVGGMANGNELLGLLHGFYGFGAMIAPVVATALVTEAGWKWFEFYYLVAGLAFLEVILLGASFWTATAEQYRRSHATNNIAENKPADDEQTDGFLKFLKQSKLSEALSYRVTWVCSIFLLAYVGTEVAFGGWITTFMLRVRHGSPFASGLVSTGFWGGLTLGRFTLGFVTPRFFSNEKVAVVVYLVATIVLELLFWLIPNFGVSSIMATFLGYFLAPLFPAAVMAATKLLPRHMHVTVIGFTSALGASGATIFPFAVGVIAEVRGVQVLQPIILALLVVALVVWLCLPNLPGNGGKPALV